MPELTCLSLFSGIGGADLAALWAGIKTVAFSEIDPYCCAVLEKHWPDVPNLGDIKDITRESFHELTGHDTADIISGGFPCQPFSVAGKRRGTGDDRYLWPEMLRVIKDIRPTWVIGENVVGFVSMGLDSALSDLEAAGYQSRAFILPACAVGALHQRERLFIVGHAEHNGLSAAAIQREHKKDAAGSAQGSESAVESARAGIADGNGHVADAYGIGLEEDRITRGHEAPHAVPTSPSTPDDGGGAGQWEVEPSVGRMADGVPCRVDRLKCLGNAIVPQQIYPIFAAIMSIEENSRSGKEQT